MLDGETTVTSLRVLVVGKFSSVGERLNEAGHWVTSMDACEVALEALQIQKFDAVVVCPDLKAADQSLLAQSIRMTNNDSNARTVVLGVSGADKNPVDSGVSPKLDGYLPEKSEPEALSQALLNLAMRSPLGGYCDPREPGLAVLNVSDLQEHLDFDNDLLLELVDLFHVERERQVVEMRKALAAAEMPELARLAHTIKGSLGSLQAPAARSQADRLEKAAIAGDVAACTLLMPGFERKLDELGEQLRGLSASLLEGQ